MNTKTEKSPLELQREAESRARQAETALKEEKGALLKRIAGVAAVALVVGLIAGYNPWGSWVSADQNAKDVLAAEQKTHVAYLAEDCAANFMAQTDAEAQLAVLRETKSYDQAKLIPENWRKLPGATSVNNAIGTECIKLILTPPADPATTATAS